MHKTLYNISSGKCPPSLPLPAVAHDDDVNLSGAASLLMCRAHKLAAAGI